MAFFNQARSDIIIQGPRKKYEPIVGVYLHISEIRTLSIQTGGHFIADAMAKNRMQSAELAKQAALVDAQTAASIVHFVPEHMRSGIAA